jgi:hypothetical protein
LEYIAGSGKKFAIPVWTTTSGAHPATYSVVTDGYFSRLKTYSLVTDGYFPRLKTYSLVTHGYFPRLKTYSLVTDGYFPRLDIFIGYRWIFPQARHIQWLPMDISPG